MNAESLERLFKLTIDGREDLATFVEGLYEYLERVLEVNKFRRVFDDQLKQRDAEKGPSIKNSVRIKIWSAFELLLEFKLACDLVQEDLRLIATIRRAEAQGLRGTKVIRMREALKYLSAPKGTSLYTECRQNLNEVQLRSAVKSVHSYLLLQLLRVGSMLQVLKIIYFQSISKAEL
jgi:hypothetical protein